ncbi:MAG: efflux RND transporter permease subunit [Aestuariibacter sp.]
MSSKFVDIVIQRKASFLVFLFFFCLLGLISIKNIPVEVTPNVNSAVVSVSTFWENASPQEVETDIISRQEKVLTNLNGLVSISSKSSNSLGVIKLTFNTQNIDEATQQVLQKLEEVPFYPASAQKPIVKPYDPDAISYIAWAGVSASDPSFDASTLFSFIDRTLVPRFERIKGISQVGLVGAREEELQIILDPIKMASRKVTVSDLVDTVRNNNLSYSGGTVTEGKMQLRIRADGRLSSITEIQDLVIRQFDNVNVYLRDVATVQMGYKKKTELVRARGLEMPYLNFQLAYGANLLETMDELQSEFEKVNASGGILEQEAKRLNLDGTLKIVQTWDTSVYVHRAIAIVKNNVYWGGLLASIALFLFLRTFSSVLIIALTIPVCVLASMMVLNLFGRTINIVSLAGIAFSVGMVIDNAIVVLENIYKNAEQGKSPLESSVNGSKEVLAPIFISTVTSLVVFLPVLLLDDIAVELFKDMAIAVMSSVGVSFIVAITLIPIFTSMMIKSRGSYGLPDERQSAFYHTFTNKVGGLVERLLRREKMKKIVAGVLTAGTVLLVYLLIPPMDYLPRGQQNGVFGIILTPPGNSPEVNESIALRVEQNMRPTWEVTAQKFDGESRVPKLASDSPYPQVTVKGEVLDAPPLEHYFIVALNGVIFHGAVPTNTEDNPDIVPMMRKALRDGGVTDTIDFAFVRPLFQEGGRSGSAMNIHLMSANPQLMENAVFALMDRLRSEYGYFSTFPDPSNLSLPVQELRFLPDDVKLKRYEMTRQDFGLAVATIGDGLLIPDAYAATSHLKDIKIKNAETSTDIESRFNTHIATPNGSIVNIADIATVERVMVTDQIKHVNREPAISLEFTPPKGIPLAQIQNDLNVLIAELRESGKISEYVRVETDSNAGALTNLKKEFIGDGTIVGFLTSVLFLCLFAVYMTIYGLFKRWTYPLVIMFSVPLASLGGFIGLYLMHAISKSSRYIPVQNFDVLTLLGFVILSGIVVNNSILIVHKAIDFQAKNQPLDMAIVNAVKARVRPILMTVLTSVGGMIPLVLVPGEGAEIYRGIGSVVVGGLLFSTVFTFILIPILVSIVGKSESREFELASMENSKTN